MKGIRKKDTTSQVAMTMIFSCGLPLLVSSIKGPSPYVPQPAILYMFWALTNFLFITAVVELIKKCRNLLHLEELDMKKTTIILNVCIYFVFLIYINLYFVQQLYIRGNVILDAVTNINTLFILLVAFIINLFCGQFPEEDSKENLMTFTLNEKTSIRNGQERFGVLVGEYKEGIVLAYYPFKYKDIETIYHERKTKALVIKGKNESGNFRISVEVPKSKFVLEKIIKQAQKRGDLEGTTISI